MHELSNTINNYKKANIAVIGDLCLDMYYFLTDEKSEISVETGIQTRSVSKFTTEAGGAGNVAVNLKTLGAANVDAYGVIGDDPFGKTLTSILTDAGVNCSSIQTQETDWNTQVYHKFYEDAIEQARCDIGNFNIASELSVNRLIKELDSKISLYDAVIINEQIADGYHNEYFQSKLSALIKRYEDSCIWITDCRHLNNIYNRTIRKLNIHEAMTLFNELERKETPALCDTDLLKRLYSYWEKPLVITLGENGAIAIDSNKKIHRVDGINIIGRTDTVGAGDAFLSAFALTLAAGSSIERALQIGNLSAGVSVTKVFQTGHPTADEVLKISESTDYRYKPEIAADIRKAEYLNSTKIELLGIQKPGFPRVAIFDHDGTISTLRQGWEPIMKEVCINAVLGARANDAAVEEIEEVSAAAVDMIEKTTGIQTIIQMHHLKEMVLSFGYVPAHEVLTPLEYKKIYNDKLLNMVSGRIDLLKKGLLSVDDVTLKGAVSFLELLHANGVKIYLASGTDMEDVKNEASILGYDSFFNGGIYGSVGNVSSDPKREVIETIINSLPDNINADECYVFGDGPVEMREAAKRDFTRIGIVSDEKQRYGINYEKRSRLILGGAQALIPDFSWIPALADYLKWENK